MSAKHTHSPHRVHFVRHSYFSPRCFYVCVPSPRRRFWQCAPSFCFTDHFRCGQKGLAVKQWNMPILANPPFLPVTIKSTSYAQRDQAMPRDVRHQARAASDQYRSRVNGQWPRKASASDGSVRMLQGAQQRLGRFFNLKTTATTIMTTS